jgi:transcriptional regulator with XRE-family HTH domain
MAPAPSASARSTVDQAFGRVLRQLRTSQGVSQEALGLASGNGRTFVSQLERGERGASLKTIFRLAAELDTRPSEIVRLVEELLGLRK